MEKRKNTSFIESGYSENPVSNISGYLSELKPMKTTGTTCDAFEGRWQSRHVFIKKLKTEFSSHPIYRTAFKKEYELGVKLKHQSLPLYLNFTGDSIIMEFVDGKTLYDMIRENDPWLHKNSNLIKLINQLLNVLDYLHSLNILHCDLKEDNLMVTNDTRNLILIDLDKVYTDSFDNTYGTPSHYTTESESVSARQMDIRGLENILKRLIHFTESKRLKQKIQQLLSITKDSDTTLPDLIELWNNGKIYKGFYIKGVKTYIAFLIFALICISLIVVIFSKGTENTDVEKREIIENGVNEHEIPIQKAEETAFNTDVDLNKLIEDDLQPLSTMLQGIEERLKLNLIGEGEIPDLISGINSEMMKFNNKILENYPDLFPGKSKDSILMDVYETKQVKEFVFKRDNLLKTLCDIETGEEL